MEVPTSQRRCTRCPDGPAHPAPALRGRGSTLSGVGRGGGISCRGRAWPRADPTQGQSARCFLRGTPPCPGGRGTRLARASTHPHPRPAAGPGGSGATPPAPGLSASGAAPAERRDGDKHPRCPRSVTADPPVGSPEEPGLALPRMAWSRGIACPQAPAARGRSGSERSAEAQEGPAGWTQGARCPPQCPAGGRALQVRRLWLQRAAGTR